MRNRKTEKNLAYLPFSRRPLVCVTLMYIAFIFVMYFFMGIDLNKKSVLEKYAGQNVTLKGTVETAVKKDSEYCSVTVSVDKAETEDAVLNPGGELVTLSLYGRLSRPFYDLPGRSISFRTELELPDCRRNPGTFDYRLYLKTKKIYVTGEGETSCFYVSDKKISSFAGRFRNYVAELKHSFTEKTEGGLAGAVFFGDKSGLDDDTYEMFQKNGTAHVLAVSGLHIGIIYGFICFVWKGRKRGFFSAVTCSFLFFYAALSDFSPSVMRACIMIALHILSKLMTRRYDMLTAASAAALISLLLNPMQIFSTGFQLSYLAVSVLSVLIPVIPRDSKRLNFFLPLFLQLAMLPYTVFCFNCASLISFFINIPVIFLADLILPVGVILLFLTALGVSGPLSDFVSFLVDSGLELLVRLNEMTCVDGVTTFNVKSPSVLLIALFYGLFFLLFSEFFRIYYLRHMKRELRRCFLSVFVVVLVSAVSSGQSFRNCDFVFVDVGQGDCMHLRTGGGMDMLFDSGGKKDYDLGSKTLKPYLLKNGASDIDAAFITHNHTDHFEGLKGLSEGYRVKSVFFSKCYEEIRDELESGVRADEYGYLDSTNELSLGKKCSLEILRPIKGTPLGDTEDENANSMIMKITCDGVSVLITGDIDTECEKELVSYYRGTDALKCDILKIAHHGSRYSTCDEFLDATDPDIAMIQVGENTYGHPTDEVLDKLEERGIEILRNDLNGAVGFEVSDGEIEKIHVMIDEKRKE